MGLRTAFSLYRRLCIAELLLLACLSLSLTADAFSPFSLAFRSATPNDLFTARQTMFQEKMNPLSISQDRLLVAFDDSDERSLLGFGQIRPLDGVFSELASLYVKPENRQQGIGGAMVQQLIRRHDQSESPTTVCLLTLSSTSTFYEKHGFELMDEVEIQSTMPSSFRFEYAAGSVVSSLLGNGLVCMIRR
jgi:N-acetylglutamate synthase-like GNAT family acetyltransferase